jgi:hypothetical protein
MFSSRGQRRQLTRLQVSCIPRGRLGACERCLHSEQCSTGMQLEVGDTLWIMVICWEKL